MEFIEAKEFLKNGYLKAGLELVDEHPTEIFLKYRGENSGTVKENLRITKEDIEEYAASEMFRSTLEVTAPIECGICGPTYCEQMLQNLDRRGVFFSWTSERNYGNYVFGDANSGSLYVEISKASMHFINYFRLDKTYIQLSLDRHVSEQPEKESDFRQYLYKPLTVQVHNIPETSSKAALIYSSSVIDACLFEISYLKQMPFRLADEWPIRERRLRGTRRFEYGESVQGNVLPLPTAKFNSDIISFYQLGMSNNIPVLQFLAFYQVLEFFFNTVSDEQLYNKLARQLKDPKFNTTHPHLDRLIQDVLDHKRITDETEMLKNVLSKFVDEMELIKFIESYENHLSEKIYSKKRNIFGVEIEVKLTPGHVISNVAKTIKAIRNALVHSSDSYERSARHIPFSKSTEMIKREIPLVKFLAERVIIASAK